MIHIHYTETKMYRRKLIKCEKCTYTTDRKCNLKSHIMRKHLPKEMWDFICPVCSVRFASKQDVDRHVEASHPGTVIHFLLFVMSIMSQYNNNQAMINLCV